MKPLRSHAFVGVGIVALALLCAPFSVPGRQDPIIPEGDPAVPVDRTAEIETRNPCPMDVNPDVKALVEEANRWSTSAYRSSRGGPRDGRLPARKGLYRIPVNFHVITQTGKTGRGQWVNNTHLQNQLNVLNAAYNPHGIAFTLAGTTRHANDTWYNAVSGFDPFTSEPAYADRQMSEAINTAPDSNVLHVYVLEPPYAFEGVTGWARYPWWYYEYVFRYPDGETRVTACDPRWDGIRILNSTLPGGLPPYGTPTFTNNTGKTLVHEVGHWLGLYHTFQGEGNAASGTCARDLFYGYISVDGVTWVPVYEMHGDMVLDTPTHSAGANVSGLTNCGEGRDTCAGIPGTDPVHNYMNYTLDSNCLTEFTSGQAERMIWNINVYRSYIPFY